MEEYLKIHNGGASGVDNHFFGPKYFFVIRDKGLIIPRVTWVRVNLSPIPDVSYFVNTEFMLQSHGGGHPNMSCELAEKGVYDPREVLRKNGQFQV